MRKDTCFREFVRYSSLSILGTLGVSCYILADTFFISKGMGIHGLAALNLAIPVFNFIYGIGLMLGMGGATKFSICKNQKNRKMRDIIFSSAVYPGVAASLLFVFIGLFFSGELAALLGGEGEVLTMTDTYLKCLLLFSPAFVLNNILLCFVRNDGSPQLSMLAMIVGSFSNIILDYIFIFPMGMGIFGAVLATGFSPVISIGLMSFHWIKKKNTFHLVRTRLHGTLIRQEMSLGLPSLIAQLSSGIVMIIFNMLILDLEGNTGVAAYGVIANISIVVVAVYSGLSQGIQPLISSFYGAGQREKIRQALKYGIVAMLVISAAVYLLLFLMADPVAAIFNSEYDEKLQEMAVLGLKLYFTSNAFVGFNMILSTYFTSVEKTIPAHAISLLRGFVLIIPLAFGLSAAWGMTGIWSAYPAAELMTAIFGAVIFWHMEGRSLSGHWNGSP